MINAAWLSAVLCTGLAAAWAQTTPPATPRLQNESSLTPIPDAAWLSLKEPQRKALAPLAPHWSQLSAGQKNKWLALSNNFSNLSDKEQSTLHERMVNWAALSPQQRAQARLTFNETKDLGLDQKKTQWEAYQALSSEDKKKLAAQQPTGIQGAATASKAPSPNKVIRLQGKSTPPIDMNKSTPGLVIDKKTLLPTRVSIPEGA